jgi:hypothetical protein
MARQPRNSYLVGSGKPGNRDIGQRIGAASGAWAAVGPPRRASPDEETREHSPAASGRFEDRRRHSFELLDLRQCRYVGPVRHLPRPAPGRPIAVRGRGSRRSLGARPFEAVPGALPRARRTPFRAGRRSARRPYDRPTDQPRLEGRHRRGRARDERDFGRADNRPLPRRAAGRISGAPHAAGAWPPGRRRTGLSRRGHARPSLACQASRRLQPKP